MYMYTYTLHPTPYTLHITPYTLHLSPYLGAQCPGLQVKAKPPPRRWRACGRARNPRTSSEKRVGFDRPFGGLSSGREVPSTPPENLLTINRRSQRFF